MEAGESDSGPDPADANGAGAPPWPSEEPASTAADLLSAAELVERLLEPCAQRFSKAAQTLAELTGSLGCALGKWSGAGEPVLFATHGEIGVDFDLPGLFRFYRGVVAASEAAPAFRAGYLGHPPVYFACGFRPPGRDVFACILRAPNRPRSECTALGGIVVRLLESERARRGTTAPEIAPPIGPLSLPSGIVRCESAAMRVVYREIQWASRGHFPVLVAGETGVGKEHVVRSLHEASDRRCGTLVAVNCAAIPAELLEAEMFGIGPGVATGVKERVGKFMEANGGTLFLDEIGDLPTPLQAKLLRALESEVVEPLGGTPRRVDTRIIAATNRDLRHQVNGGLFRADLYYRLAGYELVVPALRDRAEDIPLLLQHFLGGFCTWVSGITRQALEALINYSWPGNVRELVHEARRLVHACGAGQPIELRTLSPKIRQNCQLRPPRAAGQLKLSDRVAELERQVILDVLERQQGKRTDAARELGVSRNGLALKIRRLGIRVRRVMD